MQVHMSHSCYIALGSMVEYGYYVNGLPRIKYHTQISHSLAQLIAQGHMYTAVAAVAQNSN